MRPTTFISEFINRSMMICRYLPPPPFLSCHVAHKSALPNLYIFHYGCPPQRSLLGVQVALYNCFPSPKPTIPRIWPTFFGSGHLLSSSSSSSYQGCGDEVKSGAGVQRSRRLWTESESELESVQFCQLRLRLGFARYQNQ